ncbi:ion transporter [Cyanobium sp. ATX 6A2]|nr:ion transporter [Cyanobium sp. ATX 6A2]
MLTLPIPLLLALLAAALLLRQAVGRRRLRQIIFEADTPAGKQFDLALLALIVLSVVAVGLESDPSLQGRFQGLFLRLEVGFSSLFSLEYLLRLLCSERPLSYARSFFGIVDFLASIPPLLGLGAVGSKYFTVIRILRLMRVFRILKLGLYIREADRLKEALLASRRKIFIFLLMMVNLVVLIGALMYVIEGEAGGFTSIPTGIYWAIVTITTVGYGDVAPVTPLGRIAASAVMLLGYSIIAVPTGIVTAELGRTGTDGSKAAASPGPKGCDSCGEPQHLAGARFCHRCGATLIPRPQP